MPRPAHQAIIPLGGGGRGVVGGGVPKVFRVLLDVVLGVGCWGPDGQSSLDCVFYTKVQLLMFYKANLELPHKTTGQRYSTLYQS